MHQAMKILFIFGTFSLFGCMSVTGVDQETSYYLDENNPDLGKGDKFKLHALNTYSYDRNQARKSLEKAAKENNAEAYTLLGYMYANGDTVKQDYSKALELFQKGSELGDDAADYRLGYMYKNGEGVKVDLKQAKKYYKRYCEKSGITWSLGCKEYKHLEAQGY